jgi:hypothetical protein
MVLIVKGEKIIIQDAEYIEHGWYIQIVHQSITLYEIPYGGGEPVRYDSYSTLLEALTAANTIT